MQVALISPIGMESWSKLGDMLFITPDNAVMDFYAKQSQYKMLDNGTYETGAPTGNEILIKFADILHVQEVVLPDYIMRYEVTVKAVEEFITTVNKRWNYAVVPQGKDPLEWIECYKYFSRNPLIDVLCIPIWLQKQFGCRSAVIHKLIRDDAWDTSKEHHLIGLDGYGELYNYGFIGPMPLIRSVDTSLPFSRTAANLEVTFEDSKVSRINLHGTKMVYGASSVDLLKRNIDKLLEVAHNVA